MKRRGPGGLSTEDAELWAHVARTVTRTEGLKRRARPVVDKDEGGVTPKRSAPVAHTEAHAKPVVHHPSPVPQRSLPQAPIEPRKIRRVVRGRDEIEARIDLHGMRQVEAHGALRGFLHRAFHNGCRMVLVITGKGRESDEDRHAAFDMFQDRDRGVLRRNVPRWLADPDLRMIVVGHTSAHVKHGGDGAFYVQLRNPEKHRG
ncbi:MAG: Smr/MutS family protein [Hyphomicrobiaceae bacterium]